MPNTLLSYALGCIVLFSVSGCIVIESGTPGYNANDLSRRLPPVDNDAQYIPPRGYNGNYYNDNDSQYVPPRGYNPPSNNDEDYYYPLYSDY